jgi:hypothetical protein
VACAWTVTVENWLIVRTINVNKANERTRLTVTGFGPIITTSRPQIQPQRTLKPTFIDYAAAVFRRKARAGIRSYGPKGSWDWSQ